MHQDWSSHRCKKDGILKNHMTYGTTILGENDVTFRTSIGEFVRGGKRMQIEGCDDWRSNLKTRGVQARVCKLLVSKGWSYCVVC